MDNAAREESSVSGGMLKRAWASLMPDPDVGYVSRCYTAIGNALIGSPERMFGPDAAIPDFYNDEEDRDFPKGEMADHPVAQKEHLQIEDFRRDLRLGLARIVVPVGFLACALILTLGQGATDVKQLTAGSTWSSPFSSKDEAEVKASTEELEEIVRAAMVAGRNEPEMLNANERAAYEELLKRKQSGDTQ